MSSIVFPREYRSQLIATSSTAAVEFVPCACSSYSVLSSLSLPLKSPKTKVDSKNVPSSLLNLVNLRLAMAWDLDEVSLHLVAF